MLAEYLERHKIDPPQSPRVLHSGTNKYPGRSFDTLETGEPLLVDKYILIARKKEAL